MSDFQAIADTGKTIINLLRKSMGLANPNSIVLCSPAEANKDVCLSLYLYNIVENVYLKNQGIYEISTTQLQYPPLTLDLYYLMTAYAPNSMDFKERALEEHKLLGKAIRILHDNSVMSEQLLQGGLAGSDLELRVTLHPISLDELTKLWGTFPNLAYKTSVSYVVSPVIIDSTRVTDTSRVLKRDLRFSQISEEKTTWDYVNLPEEQVQAETSLVLRLVDSETQKEPRGKINLFIKDWPIEAVRNPSGYYIFTELPAGAGIKVVVDAEYYCGEEVEFKVGDSSATFEIINLKPLKK